MKLLIMKGFPQAESNGTGFCLGDILKWSFETDFECVAIYL